MSEEKGREGSAHDHARGHRGVSPLRPRGSYPPTAPAARAVSSEGLIYLGKVANTVLERSKCYQQINAE